MAPLQLVANRDENGKASGKLFLDGGYSLSELDNGEYEQYEFLLSANSFKKWVVNEEATKSYGQGLTSLIITNAEDLAATDFACMTAMSDNNVTKLDFSYDQDSKTLIIEGTDGLPLDLFAMRDIYYGDSSKNINMCDTAKKSQYYYIKEGKMPDLSGAVTEANLMNEGHLKNLKLVLTLLETGVINVHWNFASTEGLLKTPFEVPIDIVDPKKSQVSTDKVLSDYVVME